MQATAPKLVTPPRATRNPISNPEGFTARCSPFLTPERLAEMAINAPTIRPRTIVAHPHFPDAHLVVITCPHCQQQHSHGILNGDNIPHRHSHCHTGNGYYIAMERTP